MGNTHLKMPNYKTGIWNITQIFFKDTKMYWIDLNFLLKYYNRLTIFNIKYKYNSINPY